MTPALTKKEAKDKCIKMWEHIAEHITDKEWRDKARAAKHLDEDGDLAEGPDRYKWHAIRELYPKDEPDNSCYLCEYHILVCDGCVLGGSQGYPPDCCNSDEPFDDFCIAVAKYKYTRASAAANRLVEKVRAWEVGE